jgi:methanogenic corrinoid protein MtbC1
VVADQDDGCRARRLRIAAELQRAYADAVLTGNPQRAEAVVRDAIDAGLPEAMIDDDVIRPALKLVGDLWADGELSIAEEHAATSITLRVITLQREAFRTARRRSSQRVLLAGAQDERHVVGLEMAASLILGAGYDVRFLGADVPVGSLGHAIEQHDPTVIGFSTGTPLSAVHMPAALSAVRALRPDVGVVVGGRSADERWATRWDVELCRHVADAVEQVDALVARARRN